MRVYPHHVKRALLAVGIAVLWSAPAAALTMDDTGFFDDPILVDFESGFPAGAFMSQTIGDVVFSSTGGTSTLSVLDLGSEKSLIEIMGSMTLDFLNDAGRVGFDYQAGTPVYFEAYDADGNLLNAGDVGGVTGMGFLGFESAVPIASVIIHDTGATFRVDNLRYDHTAPMPEPNAALLFPVGLLTVSFALRRRHSLS